MVKHDNLASLNEVERRESSGVRVENNQKTQKKFTKSKERRTDDLAKKVAWLEEEKKQWQAEEKKLSKGLEDSYKALRDKEWEIKSLNGIMEGLSEEKKRNQKEIEELKEITERVPDLKQEIKDNAQLHQEQVGKNVELLVEIDGLKKDQAHIQNQNYPQQIREKEKIVEEVVKKHEGLESKHDKLNRSLTEKEDQVATLKGKNERLEQDLADAGEAVKKLKLTIIQRDGELLKVNNELKNVRESNDFLRNLCEKLGGKKAGIKWFSNRDTFLQIIKKSLPDDRVKAELGDVEKGWLSDEAYEILSKEDQQKIKAYDDLDVKNLPKNWKEQLANLGNQIDYNQIKKALKEWTDIFKDKKPAEVDAIIKDFREKFSRLVERVWKHTHSFGLFGS
jgi:chromosome segregation ATPase